MSETLKFIDGTIITADVSRSGNLLMIENPSGVIPLDTSKIELIKNISVWDKKTNTEIRTMQYVYGVFEGFTTIYKLLENDGLVLSNDGSVYVEPEPIPPYTPTLDELKEAKRAQMSAECQQTIYNGVTVNLPAGAEHFSLKQEDQINLFGKQAQLSAGVTQLEYHQDGQPCRYYSAEEMKQIIAEAMQWVSYHTTYCNSLYTWINAALDADDLDAITYGADIPVEYQSEVLKTYLLNMPEGLSATSL